MSRNSQLRIACGLAEEDNLVRDFQRETNTFLDPEKQIKHEEMEKEWDLER